MIPLVLLDIPVGAFIDADKWDSILGAVPYLIEPEVAPSLDVPEDPVVTILLEAPLFKGYQCSKCSSFMIEDGRWVAAHLLIVTAIITPACNWRWT